MNTTAQYLASKTVAQLREIVKVRKLKGLSQCRKADLISILVGTMDIEHEMANDMNATIDGAYQVTAEEAGIDIPTYLVCQKAHVARGEIRISGFWNSERSAKLMVVVFDSGLKQAVTKGDASYYRGEKYPMPTDGSDVVCGICKETYFIQGIDSAETVSDVAIELGYTVRIITGTKPISIERNSAPLAQFNNEAQAIEWMRTNTAQIDSAEVDMLAQVDAALLKLAPIESTAWIIYKTCEREGDGWGADEAFQVWQDVSKAMGELNRTRAMLTA